MSIRSLIQRYFRRAPRVETPCATTHEQNKRTARALCHALDQALRRGQLEHADRIARSAVRLLPEHPSLAERLARLRLAQDAPRETLAIIDACFYRNASLRMLRAVCLLQTGRVTDAHVDLHRWSSQATAPLDARLLLALMEWQTGDTEAANTALRRNLRQLEDPASLGLMVLLSRESGERERTSDWAQRLRDAASFSSRASQVNMMLRSLNLQPPGRSIEPAPARVETLAAELTACEHVIPSLVEAQRREPRPIIGSLLRQAIESALPELAAPGVACEALAMLSLQANEATEAFCWAQRALAESPMSASAALLLDQCRHASLGLDDDKRAHRPRVERAA